MQIVHRISFASSAERQKELAGLGVFVADHGFVAFDVDENHDAWPALREWIARHRALDVASTRFSRSELADARWLELGAEPLPLPEDDSTYRRPTYDLSAWCWQCGIGRRQRAPFQIRAEAIGEREIFRVYGILDELFVTRDVWSNVFAHFGVGAWPVIGSNGKELGSVVQLAVEEEVGVVTSGLASEQCQRCDRIKYVVPDDGPFPSLTIEPVQAIARTREHFGAGPRADQRIVVSQELATAIAAAHLRGMQLRPSLQA